MNRENKLNKKPYKVFPANIIIFSVRVVKFPKNIFYTFMFRIGSVALVQRKL